jgi:high-affinity Fe2+/Pb2+ permease
VYLGEVRPYTTKAAYRIEMFNECMIFVIIYHLMFFTKEHLDLAEVRGTVGVSMIIVTLFLVFSNIATIAIPAAKKGINKLRRRYLIKKGKKHQALKEQRKAN